MLRRKVWIPADQADIRAAMALTLPTPTSGRPEIQLFAAGTPDGMTRSVVATRESGQTQRFWLGPGSALPGRSGHQPAVNSLMNPSKMTHSGQVVAIPKVGAMRY